MLNTASKNNFLYVGWVALVDFYYSFFTSVFKAGEKYSTYSAHTDFGRYPRSWQEQSLKIDPVLRRGEQGLWCDRRNPLEVLP